MNLIRAYEFLEMADGLFGNFTSTVGDSQQIGNSIRYELVLRPTLRDYIKQCKDGKNVKLMQNQCKVFVEKCCYYLYPEKRIQEYKLKNGEPVESIDRFTERCVSFFFQLTGIDFDFLRIYSQAKKIFSDEQKKCLEMLFTDIMQLFRNAECNQIEKNQFIHFAKLEYVKIRYALLKVDLDYLSDRYSPFRRDEMVHFVQYTLKAHQDLNSMFTDANYLIGRKAKITSMKDGFKKSTAALKKLIKHIESVVSLEGRKEIEKLLKKEIENEGKRLGIQEENDIKEYLKTVKQENKGQWKNKCIQLLIKRQYLNYLSLFAESVMFVGNYMEALEVMQELCARTIKILQKIEITNLERDAELIELVLATHEMCIFLTIQPTEFYDAETDSLDFMKIDDDSSD